MSIRAFLAGKTCEGLLQDGGRAEPGADISGLGFIIAFTLSAYLTFALVLVSYIFGQVDPSLLNTVDTHVFRMRRRVSPSRNDKPTRFQVSLALRQVLLALSDQQIVTGIAIMAAGFQGLRLGGIDSYHYQIVIYLAWMSSSVHLSALSILSPILKERPALKIWRLTGMLVLLILLLIGLIPTIGNDWGLLTWENMRPDNSGWGIPAVCFWGTTWGDGVNPDAVLGFLILILSYVWKVGGLFGSACSAYQRWVRYPIDRTYECMLAYTAKKYAAARARNTVGQIGWLIAYRMVVSVCVPYFAIVETLASFSMAIWVSCLGLVFGSIQIAVPRAQNEPLLGSGEDTWGFGQLVPLVLLVQPFSIVSEHLIGPETTEKEDPEDEKDSDEVSSPDARRPSLQESSAQESSPSQLLLQHLINYQPVKPSKSSWDLASFTSMSSS